MLIFEEKTMKSFVFIVLTVMLYSCGVHTPFNKSIREEFDLENDVALRKVQFFTSGLIILEMSDSSSERESVEGGSLVKNSSKEQNRVILPINTKGVFDGFGPNGELKIRFEEGSGKTIMFNPKANNPEGKYYMVADWADPKLGKLTYGDNEYTTSSSSSQVYLQVTLKKLQKTKKKDRYVKGMKV